MSIIPNQTPIKYNENEKNDIILTNTIKMLYTRGIIEDEEGTITKILEEKNDDNQYTVQTSLGEYLIKMLPQKITTKSKSSNIYEFLTSSKEQHSIIIVLQISNKLIMDMITEFNNTEIFREDDLMTDKASYWFIPKHILLSDEESFASLEEYKIKKREMAKMSLSDPMARYFNAKSGQIFKIIRSSPVSAVEVTYRVVK